MGDSLEATVLTGQVSSVGVNTGPGNDTPSIEGLSSEGTGSL